MTGIKEAKIAVVLGSVAIVVSLSAIALSLYTQHGRTSAATYESSDWEPCAVSSPANLRNQERLTDPNTSERSFNAALTQHFIWFPEDARRLSDRVERIEEARGYELTDKEMRELTISTVNKAQCAATRRFCDNKER